MRAYFGYNLAILIALLSFTIAGYGQRTTGTIDGTIADPQGAAIPGVTVTLTGVSVGLNKTVQSDVQGNYKFQQIPAGVYRISTSSSGGFAPAAQDGITVMIEKTTVVNIKLGLSATTESVVVTSDALGINLDVTDSKVHTNITRNQIELLPTGVSLSSILQLSPATRDESKSGGFQVDGASGSENAFMLDGITMENFRTGTLNRVNNVPLSIVQEVQIKTGGFEAEHGGASGGVVVVQTKQGTNSFHGTLSSSFIPSSLQAGPRTALSRFTASSASAAAIAANKDYTYLLPQKRDKSLNFFPEATISGPIIKNRIWFLSTYSPQIYRTTRVSDFILSPTNAHFSTGQFVPVQQKDAKGNLIAPITYKSTTKYEYSFSRVDTQIFEKLRGTASFLWNPSDQRGTLPFASITTQPPTDTVFEGKTYSSRDYNSLKGGRNSSNTVAGQLTYTPTSNLIGTFRFGRTFLNEKGGNYAIPNQTRFICGGSADGYTTGVNTGCIGGIGYQNIRDNSITTRDVSLKKQFNFDLSYIPSGSFAGRHELKGGYEHGNIVNDVESGYSGTGIVNMRYGMDAVAAEFPVDIPCDLTTNCVGVGTLTRIGTKGIGKSSFKGFYFQDKWQPSRRLTLNLGVRLEKEFLPSFNAGDLLAGTSIPGIDIGWGRKIAPRFGGAFDLMGNGKTKIFASYGWFYDRMRFELPRGSFGGDFFRVDYFPITKDHPELTYYTTGKVLGNYDDHRGGGTPSASGGLSLIQKDFRIPSNLTPAQFKELGLVVTGVDPNIKAFRQDELTVGFEKELSRNFILSTRFTRKNVAHALEDHAILGIGESENYPIGNPGEGLSLELDKATGYVKSAKPQRLYRALEIVINRRLANNYYFSANYTLSGLYGNYSGLASSDENGRTSPGVNRFFDYIINGYTATGEPDNGYLATDRRHAFKANGGYTFNKWSDKKHSTDLGFFFTALQGTPQTTFIGVMSTSIPLSKRGDLGRSPAYTQSDISLTHRYKITERVRVAFNINLRNAFNQNTVTNFSTTKYRTSNTITGGHIDSTYDDEEQTPTAVLNKLLNGQIGSTLTGLDNGSLLGRPNPLQSLYRKDSSYQGGREIRFGFKVEF